MPTTEGVYHSHWLSCIRIDMKKYNLSAKGLQSRLQQVGIETRPVWKPLHSQRAFECFERMGGGVSEAINKSSLCLPSSDSLTHEDQQFVVENIVSELFRARV